jgi:hypothetical protein
MFQALLTLLGTLLTPVFGSQALAGCPDSSRRETPSDCPWAEVTRVVEGIEDPNRIREAIETRIPGFLKQLEQDHETPLLFQLWGMSRNIDESHLSTGRRTVSPAILKALNSIWNVGYDNDYIHGHAGLTHTYGYLFSNLETPFGYKRARYARNEIESGFGLPAGLFSGRPAKGTLFSNLTVFAGKIAFRDHEPAMKLLDEAIGQIGRTAPAELLSYPYGSLKLRRLVEWTRNDAFTLELRTDIVSFPKANPAGRNTALLIYSMVYKKDGKDRARPRLITVFPVDSGFAANLFKADGLGERVPFKLKYNASVQGDLNQALLVGRRFIVE